MPHHRLPAPLRLSAVQLAAGIRAGKFTSTEIVTAHIERAQQVNPALNAIVCDRFDTALAEASQADALAKAGGELPPLHGVPCTIKESFKVRGMPWTAGLRARSGVRADDDAITVERLRSAGAIVMGVTNTSELCMWLESDNPVYGRTNNPYDPRRTCGGSSGGEGAIIGAGASPFGLGADVGGSIRMPAFFNGIFGHKPGSGIVPNAGQHPCPHAGQDHLATGPLTRRAEDLMPLLRILAGPDGTRHVREHTLGDPSTVQLDRLPVISVPDNQINAVHPDLRDAQQRVEVHLRQQGARVRTARFPDLRYSFDIWSSMINEEEPPKSFLSLMERQRRRDLIPHLFRRDQHSLPAVVLGLVEDVTRLAPGIATRAIERGHLLRARMEHAMGDGIMLFPSYPRPAPMHGQPLRQPVGWTYTGILNVMGFPVTQVPLGLTAEGLPLGIQIVARPGNDHLTIAIALELERAFGGWVPPDHAPRGVGPFS